MRISVRHRAAFFVHKFKGVTSMEREILTAKATDINNDEQFNIHINGRAKQNEVEFILVRSMYMLLTHYTKTNHIPFEKALHEYSEAIYAQIGAMHDNEMRAMSHEEDTD